ncbi:porin PorA family protein [Corynebacterium sp. 22KM0430]|uniref:porin PorA family protein n=1 Tax=Corynebacterium sp. 22KM0430 TaxID=2989735 RepID=UPI0029CA5D03|nr:porin PorA family protein [Corynebacterium sp. 22KM0430]WPF65993.1 porin PorA family protein [Corynebacterium sp. 22KM0430]
MTGTRRWLIALVVAAALLTLSGDVIPRAILSSMKKLDVNTTTSVSTNPTTAHLLDVQAWQRRGPGDCQELRCYRTTAQLTETTEIGVLPTEDKKEALLQARTSLGEARWEDSVRVTRHSSFPVLEDNGALRMEGTVAGALTGGETGEFTREGLQYRFPSTTEQKSYPYFDSWSLRSAPIDYVDKTQHYFLFQQDVSPVPLGPDSPTLAHAEPVSGPAHAFYSPEELATLGLRATDTTTLTPFYAASRTLTVEPASGEIVNKREHRVVVLAASEEEARQAAAEEPAGRVLYRADTTWDEATVTARSDAANRVVDTQQRMAVVAWVSKALRFVVILAAIALVVRYRRAR